MSVSHDWLNLIEVSGPFLAVPVLREVFPQGLPDFPSARSKRLRSAYEEWRDAVDAEEADLPQLHLAWVEEVLRTALEADRELLRTTTLGPQLCESGPRTATSSAVTRFDVIDPARSAAVLLPVVVVDPDVDLCAAAKTSRGAISPADQMVADLREAGWDVGLLTNGERWMLVNAPVGQAATWASWYARLWGQEHETLRAFSSLLGVRRLFGLAEDRLPKLVERSLKYQDEVTDALGEQVRRAVEVLIQSLDRADQDRNRELLEDVEPQQLYEAGLTIMMRLVFLLAAEERGLLLLGEPVYDSFYAVSTLRSQLQAETDEVLERRRAAWARLLAVSRAVFGGIDHPNLHLPAMGGSLFDPDRFPFLEGRAKNTSWRTHAAKPLPIDDRTVLLLLDAIQSFEGRTLSYRALDVEQIGQVYEGLLERTVKRVDDVTLELAAGAKAKDPRVTWGELESAAHDGHEAVIRLLIDRSKRSEAAVRKDLRRHVDPLRSARLLSVCLGDVAFRDRLVPFSSLVRSDPWGYPLVHPKGAFVVVLGADRRETGTHYTPKSLTERIVEETLTPLVYDGPAKGAPRAEWKLKTPEQLLDLKVCDPAMGSGAFLVQACRFLSARVVEAWAIEEEAGRVVDLMGKVHEPRASIESMPPGVEARAEHARRIVAERCLYGVDLNPLAVELAKLSLWLVTLSKGRPFGFLDHNLRCGDGLLGISRVEQLTELTLDPTATRQGRLFGKAIERVVAAAVELRRKLREIPIRDIRDVEAMAALDADVRKKLEAAELLADAFIGVVFTAEGAEVVERRLAALTAEADRLLKGEPGAKEALGKRAAADLSMDLPRGGSRRPFHWPLELPEVFHGEAPGFDAIIGNPPFLGGRKIRGAMGGAYLRYLTGHFGANASGNADYCAYFFLRAFSLCTRRGNCGFLATNTIAEGDTRRTGLQYLIQNGARIYHAEDDFRWPGTASVTVAIVVFSKVATLSQALLGGATVERITASLKTDDVAEKAHPLRANENLCFQGSVLAAKGFILTSEEADELIQGDDKNAEVVMPYFTGEEVFNSPVLVAKRFVINFGDLPLEAAKRYVRSFSIVERLVKPVRALVNRKAHREYWWHYGDKRPELYARLGQLKFTLVQTHHTKYLCPQFVPTGPVFSHSMVVFPTEEYSLFGLLNSQVHEAWARETSGSIGTGLRYTPTDCLYTFPLPEADRLTSVADAAKVLEQVRLAYRKHPSLSVNEMMDLMNDPTTVGSQADAVRTAQRRLDEAVAAAYRWNDLDLGHAFRGVPTLPEDDRIRFAISESARVEVVRRLSELNRESYERERSQPAVGRRPTPPVAEGELSLTSPGSSLKTTAPAKKGARRRAK